MICIKQDIRRYIESLFDQFNKIIQFQYIENLNTKKIIRTETKIVHFTL